MLEGQPVAGGPAFEEVAADVVERLLAEPREVLTLLTGEGAPAVNGLLDRIAASHPEVEVEVQDGGQPHYHLLLGRIGPIGARMRASRGSCSIEDNDVFRTRSRCC